MSKKHPPIILFDFDGVILDNEGVLITTAQLLKVKMLRWAENIQEIAPNLMDIVKRFDKADSVSKRKYIRILNANFRDVLPHRVRRFIFFAKFGRRVWKNQEKYSSLIPNAPETLQYLHSKGIILGICSNNYEERIRSWLSPNNINQYINSYASREYKRIFGLKPSAGPIFGALTLIKKKNKLGPINREDVIFVGDTPTDILAAKHANVKSIGVLTGHNNRTEIRAQNPDYILNSIADIPSILKDLFPTHF